jgi:O-antigen ligase
MTVLVLASGIIWLAVLLHQIARRGFLVLIIWLLIAPVLSNLLSSPGQNPFFSFEKVQKPGDDVQEGHRAAFLRREDNPIRLNQLLEPTRSLLAGFLIVFILQSLIKKRRLVPLDSVEVWMGIFSLILLISVLLQSFRLHYSVRVACDAFIVPFFAYFITRRLVTNEVRFHQFSCIMSYTGFYLIASGLIELLVHQSSVRPLAGPFQTAAPFFVVIMVIFFTVLLDIISHGSFGRGRRSLPDPIQWIVLLLTPIIIFLTFSRGNWLGFLAGIWIFLFMARRKIEFSYKLGILGLALITIPLIAISLTIFIPEETMQTQISNTYTIYGRIATWLIAIEQGFEHPIIGIGLNDLRYVLDETRTSYNSIRNFGSVHNSFLAIFAEQGVTGLFAYLAMLVCLVRKAMNLCRAGTVPQDQWRAITLIAVITAYHLPALFASTLHDHNILAHFYVYVFVGAIVGLHGQHQSTPNLYTSPKHHQWISNDASIPV